MIAISARSVPASPLVAAAIAANGTATAAAIQASSVFHPELRAPHNRAAIGERATVPPDRAGPSEVFYRFEKITGDKGFFNTKIAYVKKSGARFDLIVAD